MTIPNLLKLTAGGLAFAAVASSAGAQCTPGGPPSPVAVKGAIVGIVMDTSHRVLENVDVFIRKPYRAVKTDTRGRFQLSELESGGHELTVRRIGYEMAVSTIIVTDSGGIGRFCLIPEPRALPTMISSAGRPGLAGVVGDSTYNVLPGAEVRAVAGGAKAITDSAGGFYLPLKTGTYAIVVKKEGFGSQLLSVTIPEDSGRKIAVWLSSPARSQRRIEAAIEDSMRFRLLMARPNRAKLLSSEDLAKSPAPDLTRAVQIAAIEGVSESCEAVIDGGPFTLPLSLIDKSDIAAVEVYASRPARQAPTSVMMPGKSTGASVKGLPGTSSPTASDGCNVKVYVWMKP